MYARAQRFASKFWVRMIEVLGKDLTCKDPTKESRFCLFKHVLFIYMSFFKAPLGAKGNGKRKSKGIVSGLIISFSKFLSSSWGFFGQCEGVCRSEVTRESMKYT